jgi:hypothetical protein
VRIFMLLFLPIFVGCSHEVEFQEEWLNTSCATDNECTGVFLKDVCVKPFEYTCATTPLRVEYFPDYQEAYEEALAACSDEPSSIAEAQPCVRDFKCIDDRCKIFF